MSLDAHNARYGAAATITPNAGLRGLYELLDSALRNRSQAPAARGVGLRFSWMTSPHAPSSVAVAIDGTPPSANPVGYIRRDGSFQWTARGTPEITIALRNLAADPGRRFRRYGFESMLCPFCGDRLRHGTLSFGVGYCAECAHRVGWPHDERAAKLAEDLLRRDIMREIEEEDESHGLDGKA